MFSGLLCLFAEHFDGKGIVEEYLRSKKDTLPFTIVRFAFYFNNITTLTKPEKVAKNSYALNIPMQGVAMDGIDVKQGGECVYGKQLQTTIIFILYTRRLGLSVI